MKNVFSEYYTLTKPEISAIWKDSLIVFDTNVLLNFYRYSEKTIDEFFKLIHELSNRIWIPYQIGSEFHQERLVVIQQQAKVYDESLKKLIEIEDEFSNKNRNPFLSESLFEEFKKTSENIKIELQERHRHFTNRINKDDILERLSNIFDNKIGPEYEISELKKVIEDGVNRYKDKIPPGYEDKNKTDDKKYGDYIIWKQLLDKSTNSKKPVLFVTDDRKEDWWLIQSNKIILPRPELRKEFRSITNQNFYIYQPFKFLEFAKEYLSIGIDEKAIEEVKELLPINNDKNTQIIQRDILITILIDIKTENNSINDLVAVFNNDGYEVFWEVIENTKIKFSIPIPNIPDLARRVKVKFTSQIERFGFTLIDFKPDLSQTYS